MSECSLTDCGKNARQASLSLAFASSPQKNLALQLMAQALESHELDILKANEVDIQQGEKNRLNVAMIDRLSLKGGRLKGIAQDVRHVASLPDPIGEIFENSVLPNGLKLSKQRVPIGVLGVIYEARPNVTIDVAALAIKTGNCAILRGGSETLHTNRILVQLIRSSLEEAELDPCAIQFIDSVDRQLVKELLRLHQYVDLIIPRGGASLHAFCRENSTIPVITGGIGICHLFVDESADIEGSLKVICNAKTQRPTVCNALDTLLVHENLAKVFLPRLVSFLEPFGVTFRVDPASYKILGEGKSASISIAGTHDWDTEWLGLILGIKIVSSLAEAIQHIRHHSSGHSDGILTNRDSHAKEFVRQIDSAAVYVNASTRFTDGGQLGLGAEVAISTQKLHARGPMGLKELTSYKWVIIGDYQARI